MIAGLNPISEGGIVLAGRELVGPGPDRGVVLIVPYGAGGGTRMRMNIATSRKMLELALGNMAKALA